MEGKVTMLGSGTSGVKGNDIEFANITFYGKSNGVSKLGILVEELFNNSGFSLFPEVQNGSITVSFSTSAQIKVEIGKASIALGDSIAIPIKILNVSLL